jgi:hypothetical protein
MDGLCGTALARPAVEVLASALAGRYAEAAVYVRETLRCTAFGLMVESEG